jgi:hypothetical protein
LATQATRPHPKPIEPIPVRPTVQPPPVRPARVIAQSARRTRTSRAFWERRHLSRFRLTLLR